MNRRPKVRMIKRRTVIGYKVEEGVKLEHKSFLDLEAQMEEFHQKLKKVM